MLWLISVYAVGFLLLLGYLIYEERKVVMYRRDGAALLLMSAVVWPLAMVILFLDWLIAR